MPEKDSYLHPLVSLSPTFKWTKLNLRMDAWQLTIVVRSTDWKPWCMLQTATRIKISILNLKKTNPKLFLSYNKSSISLLEFTYSAGPLASLSAKHAQVTSLHKLRTSPA